MNPMQHMKDPAAGLAPQLLPHLHLVSKYRYPITNNPSLETIVGYLMEASKIVRDLQPVQWQYLDSPPDGTLLLTWQPLDYLGTTFASDGYIYGDPEQVFKSDVRGYILEMFMHRSGYRPGEPVASHSRRRYRLLPGNPNLPGPDPSLFIIHYSKASQRDHVPAASIPVMPPIHSQMQQRRMIQSQGQLARKEFMLHDRSNWPSITVPQGAARPGQPGAMAVAAGHRRGTSIAANEVTLEEEEDVSRGDILDFMTPRDISRMRYEQHHEWMEEVLETPYNIMQIIPGDLGLGRKGELEELTKDFFDVPISALRDTNGNAPIPRVGRLAPGKAEDFRKRADQKIADMEAELERMRQRHKKRMDKLQRTTMLNTAEKRLRAATSATTERSMSSGSATDNIRTDPVDVIAGEVEITLGKKIEPITNVMCVARGGLEERFTNPALANGTAAKLVTSPPKAEPEPAVIQDTVQPSQNDEQKQQMSPKQAQPQPQTQTETEHAQQQPQRAENEDTGLQSKEGSEKPDANDSGVQPFAAENLDLSNEARDQEAMNDEGQDYQDGDNDLPDLDDMDMDVDMAGLVDSQGDEGTNMEGNEWVMVDEDNPQEPSPEDENQTADQPPVESGAEVPTSTEQKPIDASQPTLSQQQVEQQQENEPVLDTNDFDMGADFDNVDVDTAGDALASYGHDEDDLNLDNMDDSAFGDAFGQDDHDIS